MFVVCGEALMDVYAGAPTSGGLRLDARLGGSPYNVAVGLARLGRPVAFLGGISTDAFGERLMRALVEEGVDTALVRRSAAPTTLSVVSLDAQGVPQYAFHGEGAADRDLPVADLPALPAGATALHFGSYAMAVEPVGTALRTLAARERGRRLVAYDPNVRLNVHPGLARWQAVVEEMAGLAHLVKVSAEDLALLCPGEAPEAVVQRWLARGVRLAVVTQGGAGCRAWTRAVQVAVPAPAVTVVDTVGAGDAFQAALLAWLDEQGLLAPEALEALEAARLKAALRLATQAAGLACARRGADLPRRDELPGAA
ncbi:carbohydrate kinase [Caldimonas thermodepolymerans]|uniref:Carbohydrate kinase n=1 Tax=Caldimonas thermodepolymerans TaxID=215580 RepID=A0A2S5T0E3_9BURK|nr:carbohydrate kinase [Caldimonas thermodepolymerans]PPE68450.1 carbohydrate kinase [Caldimonas thermodepolymerans]QPC30169.1 carbohydrate kinase [Caldimonas thermodepolymerans]RDI00551.1 fructokinase [Caldimonas thermodepolymerans]